MLEDALTQSAVLDQRLFRDDDVHLHRSMKRHTLALSPSGGVPQLDSEFPRQLLHGRWLISFVRERFLTCRDLDATLKNGDTLAQPMIICEIPHGYGFSESLATDIIGENGLWHGCLAYSTFSEEIQELINIHVLEASEVASGIEFTEIYSLAAGPQMQNQSLNTVNIGPTVFCVTWKAVSTPQEDLKLETHFLLWEFGASTTDVHVYSLATFNDNIQQSVTSSGFLNHIILSRTHLLMLGYYDEPGWMPRPNSGMWMCAIPLRYALSANNSDRARAAYFFGYPSLWPA
ncbi:hypothetical protein CONPUDRAFT_165788 [Coniophora puteana RWD-64-598 SS2]|uniref:Uncharacterized protein n=1 Tax=Coniophora puteana (strain RWD-64-598) TaxID=741705 RepID=A0A5M3MM49_CONPW|nr:uncharacterized protein CONPUDRAFT_165788 [Coniophora puteana RWD-64-598 SS2]EIW80193.1 hypothetical protein CONPUDRAFT_165788 [Coniophora puteana RWD-64-598 SS2]